MPTSQKNQIFSDRCVRSLHGGIILIARLGFNKYSPCADSNLSSRHMAQKPNALRAIPAVETVLKALAGTGIPRPLLTAIVREELAALRKTRVVPPADAVIEQIRQRIEHLRQSRIRRVINATGVVVHTNLGRSPMGAAVKETLEWVATRYNNLEFDLVSGERGARAAYLERALAVLCGAQAATVVNNCAAALVLALRHFVDGPKNEVIISRGELVQIGGGFRIPEILEASGARLREVGTTNKTSVADYRKAISKATALILKVHRSNFFMGGFVEAPTTEEIAALASKHRVPLMEDLGSGAVVPTEKMGSLEHEPTPLELIRRGVDLVCFSGDKLFGGPQAGILAGKSRWISGLKREPFFRALRCDKMILAALQTTVDLYLSGEPQQIPILKMIQVPLEALRQRAEQIIGRLPGLAASIAECKSQIGGGTLPRSALPSIAIQLAPQKLRVTDLAARLRQGTPPVAGTIAGGKLHLDLRTVLPEEDEELAAAVRAAFAG